MYITICKTDDQGKSDARAGYPKLVLWDNPEEWGGEGSGRRLQDGEKNVHPWLINVEG